jgi:predicted  nucleic acid-binding Zn-ribbon protein
MPSPTNLQLVTAGSASSLPTGKAPPELEHGALGVAIDQAGIIVAAQPICAVLFQREPAELVGQPLELLLQAGADKIRQQLVRNQATADFDSASQPRLFALARRKDGTTFAVTVTLQQQASYWWAVIFHDVNSPAGAQPEIRAGSLPLPAPRRSRAQVAAPFDLEDIPDVFQRVPAEPASKPEPQAAAPAVAPEPPASANQTPLRQDQPAPEAAAAPPASANSDSRLHELEQSVSQKAADLKRARARLQQRDEQLHAASSTAQQATAAREEERARRTQLEAELAQARQAGDELNEKLCAEQQARTETEARLQELEQRLAQSAENLKCAQAQLSERPAASPAPATDEPALRGQVLELESRLRTTVSSLARTTAELESERGERRRSEQRAATLGTQMQQLHAELKSHLASEQTDHQRLAELEQQLHEQGRQNDLTVAKLQSSLQLEQSERKRIEDELLRSRADSARAGRALVNGLRRELQSRAESLHSDACQLLQLQASDDQKQFLQAMLENILLLQSSLQEAPEP